MKFKGTVALHELNSFLREEIHQIVIRPSSKCDSGIPIEFDYVELINNGFSFKEIPQKHVHPNDVTFTRLKRTGDSKENLTEIPSNEST